MQRPTSSALKGHIMHLASRVLSLALLCLGLAACFTSKAPLIGPDDAAFPFERIVFAEVSRPDDRQSWTRKGDAYSWRIDEGDEREALMRLKAAGENLYVVQMEFSEAGKARRLYALLRADVPAKRVYSYASIKPDAFEAQPGLSICDDSVCIDDLDAYVAYAKGRIDAGAPPDAEYEIIEME
jgi:hypothetical protein